MAAVALGRRSCTKRGLINNVAVNAAASNRCRRGPRSRAVVTGDVGVSSSIE